MAVSIAKNSPVELEDLIQEGYLALADHCYRHGSVFDMPHPHKRIKGAMLNLTHKYILCREKRQRLASMATGVAADYTEHIINTVAIEEIAKTLNTREQLVLKEILKKPYTKLRGKPFWWQGHISQSTATRWVQSVKKKIKKAIQEKTN